MKKYRVLILFVIFSSITFAQSEQNKRHFDINKHIDIYNSVLKEMDMFYVDSVAIGKVVKNSIVKMLSQLDPYTNYIDEKEMSEFKFMTTGEYAGIGSIISYVDSSVVINEPYEGLPAAKAGLKAGDVILEINDASMRNATVKEVSDKLKGMPGTIVKIRIQRPDERKPRVIKVTREKITIHPITYSGMIKPGTGYIHFSSFTENGAKEVKDALVKLKNEGASSLILDLRSNGGGILDEAVSIVGLFLPKGTRVVSTKGKVRQWDRVYRTHENPIDTIMPVAVLIDGGSASASEIVAGAMQDLDRGMVIGSCSFGKGLVQTTRQLPYGGTLKVTTSKYYTPSGRCIQAMDYSHRNEDGSVGRVPDSLTNTFKTKNLREVRDGGGIIPDIIIEPEKPGTISYYLLMNNVIFNYATEWAQKHKQIAPVENFELSDADYSDFKNYVKSIDFEYDRLSEKNMEKLKEVMKFEGYMKTASKEFEALSKKLVPDLERDLDLFKLEIKELIAAEIVKRYYYKRGMLRQSLKTDKVVGKALEIVADSTSYWKRLHPKPDYIPSAKEIKAKIKDQYAKGKEN